MHHASNADGAALQEYVPFGNLFCNIHHPSASEKDLLQWYHYGRKVAIDVARGLVYLHGRKVGSTTVHTGLPRRLRSPWRSPVTLSPLLDRALQKVQHPYQIAYLR